MNLKSFTTGVGIISKYYERPDGYHLGADHDIVYLYATNRRMSDEDVATVQDLGFFQEEAGGSKYDPTVGWAAYV